MGREGGPPQLTIAVWQGCCAAASHVHSVHNCLVFFVDKARAYRVSCEAILLVGQYMGRKRQHSLASIYPNKAKDFKEGVTDA